MNVNHRLFPESFLTNFMFHNFLIHHTIVEFQWVFMSQRIFYFSSFWLNNVGAFWVNSISLIVFLSFFHHFTQLFFMSKCGMLLINESSCRRVVFFLAAIKLTHNLVEFIHLDIDIEVFVNPDFFSF